MKLEEIKKEEYQSFFNSFKYSHFLQSVTWGETCKETRDKTPCYLGFKKNNHIVAAALLLKKSMPLGYCYYYCPRGYLIDFKDTELLKEFTEAMQKYLKDTKGIYVKINPEIMYQEIDERACRISNGLNNIDIYDNLLKLGYKHQGFVKFHENNEPRYTFRRYFEKYDSMDSIDKSISKTFLKSIRRSYNYDLQVELFGNVDEFHRLNNANALKDGFIQYSDKFYKTLYEYGTKYKNIMVINIKVNGQKLYEESLKKYEELEKEINEGKVSKKNLADSAQNLNRYKQDIEMFKDYKNKKDITICSMINGLANDMMWTMYIGNDKLGEYLFAVSRVYYETIKYCFENNYRFLDLYGTIGEVDSPYKNLTGLHKYKEKFGDTYIEFIGEFDLVSNKFLYRLLPIFLKIYRGIKGAVAKLSD